MINLVIIEDDAYLSESIAYDINAKKGFNIIKLYYSIEELENTHESVTIKPDIVFLDIVLPGKSGIEAIPFIKSIWPDTNILMISVLEDGNSIYSALCEGAIGYITKDLSNQQIINTLIDVYDGKGAMSASIARKVAESFHPKMKIAENLSTRELEIVTAILDGLSYKLIANKLGISIDTVKKHIKNIYLKLQINSKSQLMKMYINRI